MSPSPQPGSVRSADALNTAIRAIVVRALGRDWTVAERALYGILRDEWVEAERAEEMTTAA